MFLYVFLVLIPFVRINCEKQDIQIGAFDVDYTPLENVNFTQLKNNLKHGYLSASIFNNLERLPLLELANLNISVIRNGGFCINNTADLRIINSTFHSIIVPELFGICPNLKHLSLINNNITLIEDSLSSLLSLETLTIRQQNNSVDFNYLENLKELTITDGVYCRIKRFDFYKLINLQKLILCRNNIQQIESDSFVNLVNLEYLNLDQNRITVFPWNDLNSLNKLETLIISNNLLTTIDYDVLPLLPKLRYFDITGNLNDEDQTKFVAVDMLLKNNKNLVLTADYNKVGRVIGNSKLFSIIVCVILYKCL